MSLGNPGLFPPCCEKALRARKRSLRLKGPLGPERAQRALLEQKQFSDQDARDRARSGERRSEHRAPRSMQSGESSLQYRLGIPKPGWAQAATTDAVHSPWRRRGRSCPPKLAARNIFRHLNPGPGPTSLHQKGPGRGPTPAASPPACRRRSCPRVRGEAAKCSLGLYPNTLVFASRWGRAHGVIREDIRGADRQGRTACPRHAVRPLMA